MEARKADSFLSGKSRARLAIKQANGVWDLLFQPPTHKQPGEQRIRLRRRLANCAYWDVHFLCHVLEKLLCRHTRARLVVRPAAPHRKARVKYLLNPRRW